jgi:mannosyltransferase
VTKNLKTRRQHGALLIFVLGGFALRLYRLGADSLWYDETVSAHLASKSLPDLIAHTARDIHPPGYYILLHLWTRLAGDTEFALAFLSVVFGMLLIPLAYALARRLLGRAVALWAALLVAISPFNLWYSQEVRMYTLGAALGLVTLWCALRIADQINKSTIQQTSKPTERRWLVGYVLAAVAGLYVLYYFGFLLVTLNLLVIGYFLLNRRYRRLGIWLLAQVAVLVLYLPWLPIAWRQATNPPVPPWRSLIPLPTVLLEAWAALSLGQSVQPSQVWPILLVIAVLFLHLHPLVPHLPGLPDHPALPRTLSVYLRSRLLHFAGSRAGLAGAPPLALGGSRRPGVAGRIDLQHL